MYNTINIHYNTINDCLYLGSLYVYYFFLATKIIEIVSVKLLTLDEIIYIVIDVHKSKHRAAKAIFAEYKDNNSKYL